MRLRRDDCRGRGDRDRVRQSCGWKPLERGGGRHCLLRMLLQLLIVIELIANWLPRTRLLRLLLLLSDQRIERSCHGFVERVKQ